MGLLTDLNNDVLILIFSYLTSDRKALRRLLRVCRRLRPFAEAHLFEDVRIYTEAKWQYGQADANVFNLFMHCIEKSPHLAHFVRHLQVYWHGDDPTLDQRIKDMLIKLSNLVTLKLVSTGTAPYRTSYLEEHALQTVKKLTITAQLSAEDIVHFMQLPAIKTLCILTNPGLVHGHTRLNSYCRGDSVVSDLTLSSCPLEGCKLGYIISATPLLKKLKCTIPYFWRGCPGCSLLISELPNFQIEQCKSHFTPQRFLNLIKIKTPCLEELSLDDSPYITETDHSQADLSGFHSLRVLDIPNYCLLESRKPRKADSELLHRLPSTLESLTVRFPMRVGMQCGVFSTTRSERKVFENEGHENVNQESYDWLMEFAYRKYSRFSTLRSIKLVEDIPLPLQSTTLSQSGQTTWRQPRHVFDAFKTAGIDMQVLLRHNALRFYA